MPAFLVPVDAGQCLIPLEKAIVLIGRQADCDVSLTHSRKISRRHCCIAQVNNTYMVRDLGSTNGVFLNGNRIDKECAIEMGDDLVIGDVRFKLQNEAPVATRSAQFRMARAQARANQGAVPPIPPPIPGAQQKAGYPAAPNGREANGHDMDSDIQDDDTTARGPSTLDGIRRHRSKR